MGELDKNIMKTLLKKLRTLQKKKERETCYILSGNSHACKYAFYPD